MGMRIEPYDPANLMLFVFASGMDPVFDSIQNATRDRELYPDWRVSQQKRSRMSAAKDTNVWVAIDAGSTVGFVAVKLDSESSMGEIYMIAVDPDFQCHGIGTALMEFALNWWKKLGCLLLWLRLRRSWSCASTSHLWKLGFRQLPLALLQEALSTDVSLKVYFVLAN